jgi:hypothetical protein
MCDTGGTMRWIITIIGLSLLIAACSTSTAVPTATPEVPAPAEAVSEQNSPEAPEPQNTDPAEVEVEAPEATTAVRDELQATDPTTVALGNGTPTLVEFFAFW